ncbi:MAG: GNAT family N-acetyltransferase [Chloroflexota bacterium]
MALVKDDASMTDNSSNRAVPTSRYNYAELADVYNRAREDYIVPMPMNARRMQEYVTAYDVDLDMSYLAMEPTEDIVNGVCMLGVRDNRTWITRLGVIPDRRRRRSGQFLMDKEIEISRETGKDLVQLEVIKGNEPAHKLFLKLGFEVTRELLVIRRPPGPVDESLVPDQMSVQMVNQDEAIGLLAQRELGAAWTEETASLLNIGNLQGIIVTLPDGEMGWVVYQQKAFQLAHFVFAPDISQAMMRSLLAAVHTTHKAQDTKIENVPLLHPTWEAYQAMGYVVAFGRIEMVLHL